MYLIHGVDTSREARMINEFKSAGIDLSGVEWIRHPNKDEITDSLFNQIVNHSPYMSCGVYIPPGNVSRGVASCSFKHYLALEDIINNKYEYAVIMEDNMKFFNGINIPDRLNKYIDQLNSMYPDWDVLFDLNYGISDHVLLEGQYVYPKTNEITQLSLGGTRCAQFYLLRYKCAEKLYEN